MGPLIREKDNMNTCDYTWSMLLKIFALAVLVMVLPGLAVGGKASPDRPNIVFIMADDLGYGDVGCYGAINVKTPNFDRLADEGVRLTDAHTPSSVCSPTRYSVLTGRYCWRTRLKKGVCLPNDPLLIEQGRTTIPSLLKSAGYATGAVGKWHLGFGKTSPDWNGDLKPGPLEIGFDYYFGVPVSNNWPPFVYVENHHVVGRRRGEIISVVGTGDDQPIPPKRRHEDIALTQTAKAVDFIERNQDKPFFLYLTTCNVHWPYTPNESFKGTSRCGIYGDFVQEFDWTLGKVLETLDRLKLVDNTLVIVTSDNGASIKRESGGHPSCGPLRGQKTDIWEGGHRVPFVARWPGKIKADTTCDELICLADMLATIATVVDKDIPDNAGEDSYNVLPALLGKPLSKPIREATVHHSNHGMFAIRQGYWKLILGRGSGGESVPSLIKTKPGEPEGQLYNLKDDLAEANNLWAQHPEIVQRMSELLNKYKQEGRSRPL